MRLVLGDRLPRQQNRFVIRRTSCMSWSLRPARRSFGSTLIPLAVAALPTFVAFAALFAILEATATSATAPPSAPLTRAFALFGAVFRSPRVGFFLRALVLLFALVFAGPS